MNLKSLLYAAVLGGFLTPLFAVTPPPGLGSHHRDLVGQWVFVEGGCSNWNGQQRAQYKQSLRDRRFYEHIFINAWDMKLIQKALPEPGDQYTCNKSFYFRPESNGDLVTLNLVNIEVEDGCDWGESHDPSVDLTLDYILHENGYGLDSKLMARIQGVPFCNGAIWEAFYRSKDRNRSLNMVSR